MRAASPKPDPKPEPTARAAKPKRRPPRPRPTPAPTESPNEAAETMAHIRLAMRGRGAVPREEVVRAVAERLGYQRVSAGLRERIDGHLRAAVRRRVLEAGGGEELRLATLRLDDYERDALVLALRAVSRYGCVYEREQLARLVLDHLGFKRLTQAADEAIKSALNGAIRRGLFERVDATQLRRLAAALAR